MKALWRIGWRLCQALGINQIAALAGQFVGLVAGGLLAALDWRAVCWVNLPVGVFGTGSASSC